MPSDTNANTGTPRTTPAESGTGPIPLGAKEYLKNSSLTIQFTGPVNNPVDKVRSVRRETARVVVIPCNYPDILKITIADLILMKNDTKPIHIVHKP